MQTARSEYLVGCDGGTSTVREALGIALDGKGRLADLRQVFFRSEELIHRVPVAGRARHFYLADGDARMIGTALVVQGDQRHFTFHSGLPADTDFVPVIERKIGCQVDIEIVAVTSWTLHLLLAESYRDGRVLLAGDAAHLVIPQGGLGMNTGIGDAMDLSWKLAGTLAGWGGPALLDSYEADRRQVGERNLCASEYAALGTAEWRKASTDQVAEAGFRLPHMWCADGTALHDRIDDGGFTLLRLGGEAADTGTLELAVRDSGGRRVATSSTA